MADTALNQTPTLKQRPCCGQIKAVTPDDGAMAAINQQSLVPLQPEDVFVGQMHLANTLYDRSDERFPPEYLQRFAETLPGKSVMRGHDYSNEPVGRFFDAEVMPDSKAGGQFLLAKYYLDANGPVTKSVQMGIAKDVSIGFMPDTRICDLDGKDYDGWWKSGGGSAADDEPCDHIKGRMYNGRKATVTYGGDLKQVEAQEGSFVWLGCQIGAQTMKDARASDEAKAKYFDARAEEPGGKGDDMKELEAALARVKELEADVARLTPLAGDGESYRQWQKAEIARLYASLGEEKAGGAMLKALDAADAGTLDEVRKEADTRHAAAFARGGAVLDTETPAKADAPKRTAYEIMFGAGRRQGGA